MNEHNTFSPAGPRTRLNGPAVRSRLAVTLLVMLTCAVPAAAQPYVYVLGRDAASPRRNQLTVVNVAGNTKGPRIALGTANNFILPQVMVMSPDGARIYVANDLESTISVVSTATHTVVDTWPTALVGTSPRALAVSPDGQRLFVSRQDGSVAAFDIASRSVVTDLALGLGSVFGLAASPDGFRVYAMATGSSKLAILSTAPFRLVTTVDLGLDALLLRADAIDVSPNGRFLYLPQRPNWEDPCGANPNCIPVTPPAAARATRVAVMDTSTNAIVATTTIDLQFYTRMYHLAVSPNGEVVYATGRPPVPDNTQLYRLSPSTHAVLGATRLNGTNAPTTGRAVTFLADSSRAYIAANDGVYVIDTSANTVSAVIPFASTVDGIPDAIVATPPPPPDPPSNLRATVVGNRVSLTWDASPSSAVAGYLLEGGVTPGSVLASIPTGQSTPGFTFDAPSGAFYIRIHAVGGGKRSTASNEIQILVNVPRPPSTPQDLRGLANGSDLALSWTNTSAGGTPSSLVLDVTGGVTTSFPLPVSESFMFSGVPAGTYTFAVRASNATGSSLASTPVNVTFPGTCPGAPQAPSNFTATRQGSQLTVSWDPPAGGAAVTSYVLNVTGAVNLSLPMTSRTISGAVPAGAYQLSVQAVNPCGTGSATPTQAVTVP